jgi:hypothetical protein
VCNCGFDGGFAATDVGNIRSMEICSSTGFHDVIANLRAALAATSRDEDVCTACRACLRNCGTDPGGSAGYQNDFPCNRHNSDAFGYHISGQTLSETNDAFTLATKHYSN